MNVLRKIIIPRIKATLTYITVELEELDREDFYRLKQIKKNKAKTQIKIDRKEPGHVCPICSQKLVGKLRETSKIFESKPKIPPLKQLGEVKESQKKIASTEKVVQPVPKLESSSKTVEPTRTIPLRRALDPLNIFTRGESNEESKLGNLMKQLGEIIALGSNFVGKKVENIDISDLLIVCEEARARIKIMLQREQIKEQPGEDLLSKFEHLRTHLHEVTDVKKEFGDEVTLSPSVDNFICICEDVDKKLSIFMRKDGNKPVSDEAKGRLEALKSQVDDVIKVTKQYQKEELLSPSAKAFLQSCEIVKSKIDARINESANQEKMEHLQEHVKDLVDLTNKVKSEGLLSESLEDFLKSCKDFKTKLALRKDKDKKPPNDEGLDRLVNQISETIELSKKAKNSGLVSASVEDFIKSCEEIKSRIESKQMLKSETPEPQSVLDELEVNIDDIMQLISKFRKDGLITESMEEFVKSCEITKAKVDMFKRYPEDDSECIMLHPCSDSCMCSTDDVSEDLCDRCNEILEETKLPTELPAPPCDTCTGIFPEDKPEDFICDSCNNPPESEESLPSYVTPESELSDICDVCRRYMEESDKEEEKEQEVKPMTPVDSTLGYFESKIRKIIRVTRTRNNDGTVREEKETIVVRKEKHDPNETTIDDNDEDFGDMSFESLIEEEDKKVGLCLVKNHNNEGFVMKSQSENFKRRVCMTEPLLRSCVSAGAFGTLSLIDIIDRIYFWNNLSQSQNSSASIS